MRAAFGRRRQHRTRPRKKREDGAPTALVVLTNFKVWATRLLSERRITEEDLDGLGEDRVKAIRSWAKVLRNDVA
jgi:hypothetical protein